MNLFGKSPRPYFNDEMLSELAKNIGKEIFEWCDGETSLDDCIADCKEIFDLNMRDNGYEFAKDFEDKGYSPDAELVEILDSVCYKKYQLVKSAVKKWVIEDKIEPEFEIGTTIITNWEDEVEGIVTGYNKDTAEYLVCIPSKGMTMNDTRRAVIKYEDAKSKSK